MFSDGFTHMDGLPRRLLLSVGAFVLGMSVPILLALDGGATPVASPEFHLIEWHTLLLRNGRVGLLLMAGGILAGIPTLGLLAFNGSVVGSTMAGFLGAEGGLGRFLALTVPHGLFELAALLLFGAVGLGIAAHLGSVLGLRIRTPGSRDLLVEALGACTLLAAASIIEADLTPQLGLALWDVLGTRPADMVLRWLAIGVVEGGCLLALSKAFDEIDARPRAIRVGYGKIAALSAPLWAMVMAGLGITLNQLQFAAWKETGSSSWGLFFILVCGLPPLLYTVARGYRAQTGGESRRLSFHLPWLSRAAVILGMGFGVAALSFAAFPQLPPPVRVITGGMMTVVVLVVGGPWLIRRVFAQEVTLDWSAPALLPAAQLLDQQGFPQSRVHLLRVRGESRVVNAMATGILPGGGRILITEDLMERLSPDEVAAVLAHEVGHIKGRHLAYAFLFQVGLVVAFDAAFVQILGWIGQIESLAAAAVAIVALTTGLGAVGLPLALAAGFRIAERDADAFAAKAGLAPYLATALEKLPGSDPGSDDMPAFARAFAFHPSRASRIRTLKERAPLEAASSV